MGKGRGHACFPHSGYCERGCFHPHVHCVVPAGGLSPDHTRWIRSPDNYFLPKKVLQKVFRGKFVDALKQAFRNGQLIFQADLKLLAQPNIFAAWLPEVSDRSSGALVVREGDTISAAGALVEMAAECGGTTPLNGPQYFDMLPTKPVAVSFDESLSRCADDIGHLQRWPAHLVLVGWLVVQCERIQRTCCCVQMALREMQVDGRFFQVLMTE
jgi:Putative transposase